MHEQTTLTQLVEKVAQQERTVSQLLKIIAATNRHVKDLQIKYEQIEQQTDYSAK